MTRSDLLLVDLKQKRLGSSRMVWEVHGDLLLGAARQPVNWWNSSRTAS